MDVAIFSAKPYDREFLDAANAEGMHRLTYFEPRLSIETARLAAKCNAVCVFVNDVLDSRVIRELAEQGTSLVALRCAGFNNVDLEAAAAHDIAVARVPAYSPSAIAEHTIALMLTLIRKTHRAYNRVREGNFSLDGLLGFDLAGKTVGIVGTGRIGACVAEILLGFRCKVLANDPEPNAKLEALGVQYVPLEDITAQSDIITLHCPLDPQTHHLVNRRSISEMKDGVVLINTSRGGVLDTRAVIAGLKRNKIGYLGLDVYEEEADLFFQDLSETPIQDDIFARLLTFPNVLITGHQGFFTREALTAIAETTIANITAFEQSGAPIHRVSTERIAAQF